MRFTKEKCREAIFLEPGDEPIHSTGEVFITYPCVFNTVSLQLAMTPFLTELANAICDEEDVLYNFYISINDYCKIDNCIEGVTKGFSKSLEVIGVGYRVAVKGNLVELSVGFSHPVLVELPEGIQAKAEGQILTISGADKELVGEMAAKIRRIRKPEPYKGKGIKFVGEVIRRKSGKTAGAK